MRAVTAVCSRTPAWNGSSRCRWSRRTGGHIYNQFVIRTPDRDQSKHHLDDAGIATKSTIRCRFAWNRVLPAWVTRGRLPEAQRAAARSLAIPIYGELTVEQERRRRGAIAEFAHAHVSSAFTHYRCASSS